ncbi:multidrug effflux MFS transporter [Catenovulum adriaticum]|uniref:Bcr/CflA family efflux transporter n=1 Tax=Catenovulum adriaticum TaxID=2984846 RepID=A0ABY7AQV2_9ALTE|nr:multidrug effflux MFS transporter [Catenovulum sp. TS8]WAJ70855.1 multidrug effflux MFS transporter [Catenovulum sp. TS8]
MPNPIPLKLTILLACIFALSPLAIDTYLPAVTLIADDLNTQAELVSMTVSLYVMGLAFGQLIGGPLSDKYGRRRLMLIGLLIFSFASCLLITAQNVELLWLYRLIQALGGGISAVCVPAIIRDHVSGAQAAKLLSFIALLMMLAPAIAPSIGAGILKFTDWHGIFIFLAFFSAMTALATKLILKKPRKDNAKSLQKMSFKQILSHPQAYKYVLAQAFGYSVLMIFLANSPLIYMEYFKLTSSQFSMVFSVNVVVIIFNNRLNSFLLNKFEPDTLLKVFFAMQITGALILLTGATLFPHQVAFSIIGFALSVGAISGIGPNAQACFLNYFPNNSGAASATFGFIQYASGAIISAVVSYFYNQTLWPVSITIAFCAGFSMFAIHYLGKTQLVK